MNRTVLRGLLVLALHGAFVVPVHAAPKKATVAESLPKEARVHFDKGFVLYESGDWAGALVEFRTAYDLSKEPRVLRNVAICEKNLKRYARALALLEQQLAETKNMEAPLRAQLLKEIAVLSGLTAPLEVKGPPGAEVLIDDLPAGTLPLPASARIDVGEHTVTVRQSGYEDLRRSVSVSSGTAVSFEASLVPAKVPLRVRVAGPPTPPSASTASKSGPRPGRARSRPGLA